MTLPKNVAELQHENVAFELECIDRMYLNLYVPQLASAPGGGSLFPRGQGPPVSFDQGSGGHERGVSPARCLDFAERKGNPDYPV